MNLVLSFKKYIGNIKIILLISVLFLFTLFLVNPIFILVGGSLDLSFDFITQNIAIVLLSIVSFVVYVITYTLIQTTIIFRVEREYNFETYTKQEIKDRFSELLKFNLLFYLLILFLCCFLYDVYLLNNPFVLLILMFVVVFFWFIPQIVVMEKEKAINAILINTNYVKKHFIRIIYLFVVSFILVFITYVIDSLNSDITTIFSILFFVLFVVPFIEILKTEIYLDKFSLLKPR
jgi:hypothetical protein